MSFRHPGFFLLFILLGLLLIWKFRNLKRGKSTAKVVSNSASFWKTQNYRFLIPPRMWEPIVFSIPAVLMIIALARPQVSHTKVKRTVEGIDIMMVLDLSASMRVEDFRDKNRLETAKPIIENFIAERGNDKIGFEIFSGEAVTLVPPTLDHDIVLQALTSAEIGDLKDGTAIGDALATAVGRMKESTAKSRIIILLTDGDSNVGSVDPLTAGELAKGYGIKVYSIAFGKDGKAPIPFIQKDVFGRRVKTYQYFDSSINPELLKQISSMTDGKFYRVQEGAKQLDEAFKEIDKLEKTKIETSEQVKHDEKFMFFAELSLVFMAIAFLLSHTVFRVFP